MKVMLGTLHHQNPEEEQSHPVRNTIISFSVGISPLALATYNDIKVKKLGSGQYLVTDVGVLFPYFLFSYFSNEDCLSPSLLYYCLDCPSKRISKTQCFCGVILQPFLLFTGTCPKKACSSMRSAISPNSSLSRE